MLNADRPDLSLFLDILRTLERIGAPYMIIGGFAATMSATSKLTLRLLSLSMKLTSIDRLRPWGLKLRNSGPRSNAQPEQRQARDLTGDIQE